MQEYDVLVRCRNEINWLIFFHKAILSQTVQPRSIIFVDDGSTDGSREFALSQGYAIVDFPPGEKFNYSKALNIGASVASADNLLVISAHCILADSGSVKIMLDAIGMEKVAGVYGRQIPTRRSTAFDTRDLLTIFGRERLVFNKYPFFHNGFSLIRRELWCQIKFDEEVHGLEDRIWAQRMCDSGYSIIYEPDAVVYHEHGLNHGLSEERALRVCSLLKKFHSSDLILTSSDYDIFELK